LAAGVLLELFVGLIILLLFYQWVLVESHDSIMGILYNGHWVISSYNNDWANVLGYCLIGVPLAIILGVPYFAVASMMWKMGG
jgi:hypothetical protein